MECTIAQNDDELIDELPFYISFLSAFEELWSRNIANEKKITLIGTSSAIVLIYFREVKYEK